MKPSTRLLAALAFAVVGAGVMVSQRADRSAEEAAGKPTKSGVNRTRGGSPAETMGDLRSASRGDLREWARSLEDGELRRMAMSFLQRLEESVEPEMWEDRARMREFLAALFMEWGRRDLAGVEVALEGESLRDLAYPTAIAGLSEIEPERALDVLAAWKGASVDVMRGPVALVATMHLARRDPEAAWARVKKGSGSMEGLAAGSGDLPALLDVLTEHHLREPSGESAGDPFADGPEDDLFLGFALGWARRDLAAAWKFVSESGRYLNDSPFSEPTDDFLMRVGERDPAAALDLAMALEADPRDGGAERRELLMSVYKGAFKSDPDAVIGRLLGDGRVYGAEDLMGLYDFPEILECHDGKADRWPVSDQDAMVVPTGPRYEKLFDRAPEFGLSERDMAKLRNRMFGVIIDFEAE